MWRWWSQWKAFWPLAFVFPQKALFQTVCKALLTNNLSVKWRMHYLCSWVLFLLETRQKRTTVVTTKKRRVNYPVNTSTHTRKHSASAVCHFTLNLITVKSLIIIFLLSHYLVFPLLIFTLTDRFVVALMFSLYSGLQTAPCPRDDKYL